jgi:hypothetical protein
MSENNDAKVPVEPKPIEFKATYYPDGRLHIESSLMNNPMLALGFLEFVKDGMKKIMEGHAEDNKPKIEKAPGSFLNGIRRMGGR